MKLRLVNVFLIAGGALLSLPALAHSPAQPAGAGATATAPKAPANPAAMTAVLPAAATTVAANTRAGARSFHAAGSVIVLVDGIVANATSAQVHPPAAGFMYER
ncbi:hypothetical protein [Aquabacterium sp. OR-4]|uniref:hypothetical protein n=1 Tax=Aquabacterium sp. OR-4 TaxID=2978127 RepID=UPI0021B3F120|nr:hypothetical protein [Aquabacterium sp. OR-4]MDT7837177.1 hypothetical protein [Aquabacterium sp. OR-4]